MNTYKTPEQQFEEYLLNLDVHPDMYKWPSSIGNCRRQLAYAYHKFQPLPASLKTAKALLEGTGIHSALTKSLLRSGLYEYQEHPKFEWNLNDKVKMPIKVDGIIKYLNQKMVFEAKSASGNSFNSMMIKGELSKTYYLQVQIYMAALNLNCAFMFLWNKDYDPKEIGFKSRLLGKMIVPRDASAIDEAIERYMTVSQSTLDSLPERDIPLQKDGQLRYECKGCRFVDTCYPKQYAEQMKAIVL